MWSDLAEYAHTVKEHWELLCVGGLFLAAELLELFVVKPEKKGAKSKPLIPHWVLRWGAVLCLFIASFQAWSDEHKKVKAFEIERPRFADNGSGIEFPPVQNNAAGIIKPGVALKFLNKGKHSATDIEGRLFVIPGSLDKEPSMVSELGGTGDYEPDLAMNYFFPIEGVPQNSEACFIVAGFDYIDTETGQKYMQQFYLCFRGTKDGQGISNFFGVTSKNREELRNYLKKRGEKIYEPSTK